MLRIAKKIKTEEKENCTETLSSEFNLPRIAKKIKTEEKENCTETLSSLFNLLRIAKKIKTDEKENCAWIKRKCKEKFFLIWNNAQRRQRIELAITECTKNEDSELVRLWYHVRMQAIIQSSSMVDNNQTMREMRELYMLQYINIWCFALYI